MFTPLPTRPKRASRWLPALLLPLVAQAQFNYTPATAVNTTTAYVDLAARGTAIATANTNDLATNNTKTSTQDVTAASLSYIEDAGPLAAIGLSTLMPRLSNFTLAKKDWNWSEARASRTFSVSRLPAFAIACWKHWPAQVDSAFWYAGS